MRCPEVDLFSHVISVLFWIASKTAQEAPKRPQDPPKRPRDPPKSAPGGPKRSPRDPRSRSRGLKTLQDHTKKLQKNTSPKTIVHINVADIAEIDEDKKLLARVAVDKGRAGGGVPPWGRQSAARPGGAEPGVLDRTPKAEAKAKSPNLKAIICLRYLQSSKSEFLAPPIIPPGGQRIPPGRRKSITKFVLLSIKISVVF